MTISMETLDPGMDEETDGWVNLSGETSGTSVLTVIGSAWLKGVPVVHTEQDWLRECGDLIHQLHQDDKLS